MACAGINDGLIIINSSEGEWVDDSQVKTLVEQAGLSDWKFIENDGVTVREKLIGVLNQIEAKDENSELFLNESADLLFHFLILLLTFAALINPENNGCPLLGLEVNSG